jgi:hypothetical protein
MGALACGCDNCCAHCGHRRASKSPVSRSCSSRVLNSRPQGTVSCIGSGAGKVLLLVDKRAEDFHEGQSAYGNYDMILLLTARAVFFSNLGVGVCRFRCATSAVGDDSATNVTAGRGAGSIGSAPGCRGRGAGAYEPEGGPERIVQGFGPRRAREHRDGGSPREAGTDAGRTSVAAPRGGASGRMSGCETSRACSTMAW